MYHDTHIFTIAVLIAPVDSSVQVEMAVETLGKAMPKVFRVSGDFAEKFRVGWSKKNFFTRKIFGFHCVLLRYSTDQMQGIKRTCSFPVLNTFVASDKRVHLQR